MNLKPLLPPLIAVLLLGCSTRHAVVTTTGNVFGFELAQSPSSGMYQAKLGYARTEFAYVPSNRSVSTNEPSYNGGATDVPDVLLELKFQNVFKGGGLYQRLAVGTTAVSQPGAAFMFAKGPDGTLDPVTANALSQSLATIPQADPQTMSDLAPLARAYVKSDKKDEFDLVAFDHGFPSFETFLDHPDPTPEQINAMYQSLRAKGLLND